MTVWLFSSVHITVFGSFAMVHVAGRLTGTVGIGVCESVHCIELPLGEVTKLHCGGSCGSATFRGTVSAIVGVACGQSTVTVLFT